MNKVLCSLACTWMTIIDCQFYIIDSLSLDVSLIGGCLVVILLFRLNVTISPCTTQIYCLHYVQVIFIWVALLFEFRDSAFYFIFAARKYV